VNNVEAIDAILAARSSSNAALEIMLPAARALDPSKVRPLNVEIPSVVSRVLGAYPKLMALREEIVRDAPSIPFHKIQKLETCAYALQESYVRCLTSGKTPDQLRLLGEAGDSLRDTLRSDARALVTRRLINGDRLQSCLGQPGYKTIATELGMLVSVFLESWPQVQGKCCVTEEELRRAKAIADALLAIAGSRELSPEAQAEAADLRDRVFTVLVDHYDVARRVVTFLRWEHGDVDEIAPSLFKGRGGSRRRDEEPEEPAQPAAPGNAAPVSNPTTPSDVNRPSDHAPVNTQIGRPNSNPFMQ